MNTVDERQLRSMKLFKNVTDNSIKELCFSGYVNYYTKDEHIFRDKDEVNTIYIVLSGKVSLYKINESAQKKIIFILGAETIINGVVVDDLPASINCDVFEKAEIFCIDRKKFVDIMSRDFELTMVVMESLAKKVRRLYRQLKNSTPIKIEKRVAAKLWKLSKDYGIEVEDGILIDLNISVTYLADMFGAPRETISRALKKLCEENLIVNKNKKIIVRDAKMLSIFFKGL